MTEHKIQVLNDHYILLKQKKWNNINYTNEVSHYTQKLQNCSDQSEKNYKAFLIPPFDRHWVEPRYKQICSLRTSHEPFSVRNN